MEPEVVTVPLSLIEKTVTILLSAPASQVYLLVKEWEEAVPGLIK